MRAALAPSAACPSCGRVPAEADVACGMCGTPLARPRGGAAWASPREEAAPPWAQGPASEMAAWGEAARNARVLGMPPALGFAVIGLLLAPVLTFTPVLRHAGWLLTSLFHESGHAGLSWLLGCPAVPAIRIDGHAAAVHGEQSVLFALMVTAALAGLTWACRRRPVARTALGLATLLQPVLAFTHAREVVFLAGGHLGELAFATVFLHRCLAGGFTESRAERAAHGMLGWYLLLRHAWLVGGLATSEAARQVYARSGSFGLTNDYIRLAGEFEVRLSTVGAWMLVPTLAVLPLSIWLARASAD